MALILVWGLLCISIFVAAHDQCSLLCASGVCCDGANGLQQCCPISGGICCESGTTCCPRGTVCNSDGSCTRLDSGFFGLMGFFTPSPAISQLPTENPTVTPATKVSSNLDSCPSVCGSLCCPFVDSVCCKDGKHCCPSGYQCDASTKSCRLLLHSSHASSGGRDCSLTDSGCRNTETCCIMFDGSRGCCPYEEADCCSDGYHCCPRGTRCNSGSDGCVPKSGAWVNPFEPSDRLIGRKSVKCPDGKSACHKGSTCCNTGGPNAASACCPLENNPYVVFCVKPQRHFSTFIPVSKLEGNIKLDLYVTNRLLGLIVSGLLALTEKVVEREYFFTHSSFQAICCEDGEHCCPQGYVCDSRNGGSCILKSNTSLATIVSEAVFKHSPGEMVICDDGSYCEGPNVTCCKFSDGSWGCCPFSNAICCLDHVHCCPNGYSCSFNQCIKSGSNGNFLTPWRYKQPAKKANSDSNTCEDGTTICPSDMTCCLTDDNSYGCCPFPNAVCCLDREHCCPSGYTCDVANSACVPNGDSSSAIPMSSKVLPASSGTHAETCASNSTPCSTDGKVACCSLTNRFLLKMSVQIGSSTNASSENANGEAGLSAARTDCTAVRRASSAPSMVGVPRRGIEICLTALSEHRVSCLRTEFSQLPLGRLANIYISSYTQRISEIREDTVQFSLRESTELQFCLCNYKSNRLHCPFYAYQNLGNQTLSYG
ncbi:unnamed protein product [Hydatigera taeniaeformis]|uniref:Granulin n=1 Tax=Hydatigena taeniaeformis TaxID=6205 RepID=A0A0R3X1Y9_HYDTA|nr:unnamed protein product [Hydatigera taeniaeformis]